MGRKLVRWVLWSFVTRVSGVLILIFMTWGSVFSMIYILTPLGKQGVCWDWSHSESFSGAFTSFSNGTTFVLEEGNGQHCSEQLHIWLCHSCDRPPPSSTPMSPFNTCPSHFFSLLSPSPPQSLASCKPALLPTYLYTCPHTHSPSLKSEKHFFFSAAPM